MVAKPPGISPRLALFLFLATVGAALGWLWWNAARRSDINFLPRHTPGQWIVYPSAPDLVLRPRLEMSTVFTRTFALDQVPAHAMLSVAGFHSYTLLINGNAPGARVSQGRNWKQPDRFEVS